MINKDSKFYFGAQKNKSCILLGTMGLMEEYASKSAYSQMKHPWFTIEDIQQWCKDDVSSIERYIEEGLKENCLIELSEAQANRLLKDPMHNCWLYE